MTPGREAASVAGLRRVRFRAAFMAIAWSLPGFWCAGNLLAHQPGSEHEALHAGMSLGGSATEVSCDHDHGHAHPESPPAISAKGTKKLDASVILTTAFELDHSSANLLWQKDTAVAPAARRPAAGSGPRAPPIS